MTSRHGPVARLVQRLLVGAPWAAILLFATATPVSADNCADLADCFSGNLWPALLLLFGLAALIAAAWFLGPLLARFAMSAALRSMFATAGRSRMAAWMARFMSRFGSRAVNFARPNLQHTFEHAKHFGVTGNWSNVTGQALRQAIQNHLRNSNTIIIRGTMNKTPVTHFFNPQTGLNVMRSTNGNLLSGWRLTGHQVKKLLTTRGLGARI